MTQSLRRIGFAVALLLACTALAAPASPAQLLPMALPVTPAIAEVCPTGCAFSQIQPAIDSLPAGGVVLVGPGTYDGGLLAVNTTVLRATDGPLATTIDCGNRVGECLALKTAAGSVVEGFTFTNVPHTKPSTAIQIHGSEGVRIAGNRFTDVGFSIVAVTTSTHNLTGLVISGNEMTGLHKCWTTVLVDGAGSQGGDIAIVGNRFHDITFDPARHCPSDGGVYRVRAIAVQDIRGSVVVAGNIIENMPSGGYVHRASNVVVAGNLFRNVRLEGAPTGAGLSLWLNTGSTVVSGNDFLDNELGLQVYCDASTSRLVAGNSFLRNGVALQVPELADCPTSATNAIGNYWGGGEPAPGDIVVGTGQGGAEEVAPLPMNPQAGLRSVAIVDADGDGLLPIDNCPSSSDAAAQPDLDGDGAGDGCDLDRDGDGVDDVDDWAPLDPSEWSDADGDGLGGNVDVCPMSADHSDGDGNGRPDCDQATGPEPDRDGDGVPSDVEDANGMDADRPDIGAFYNPSPTANVQALRPRAGWSASEILGDQAFALVPPSHQVWSEDGSASPLFSWSPGAGRVAFQQESGSTAAHGVISLTPATPQAVASVGFTQMRCVSAALTLFVVLSPTLEFDPALQRIAALDVPRGVCDADATLQDWRSEVPLIAGERWVVHDYVLAAGPDDTLGGWVQYGQFEPYAVAP